MKKGKPNWLSRVKDRRWLLNRERRIRRYTKLAEKGLPLASREDR